MARSTVKPNSVVTGTTPTDVSSRLYALLNTVFRAPQTIKCDYVRTNAEIVAMAASLHLITTRLGPSTFGQSWRITTKGLIHLQQREAT